MAATTREQRTERILVVEDEDAIRDLVATALRFTGFPVSTVASGRDAIAEIRNERFDLLSSMSICPISTASRSCRKLRADGNKVAVIFLTARDDRATSRPASPPAATTTSPSRSASRS